MMLQPGVICPAVCFYDAGGYTLTINILIQGVIFLITLLTIPKPVVTINNRMVLSPKLMLLSPPARFLLTTLGVFKGGWGRLLVLR